MISIKNIFALIYINWFCILLIGNNPKDMNNNRNLSYRRRIERINRSLLRLLGLSKRIPKVIENMILLVGRKLVELELVTQNTNIQNEQEIETETQTDFRGEIEQNNEQEIQIGIRQENPNEIGVINTIKKENRTSNESVENPRKRIFKRIRPQSKKKQKRFHTKTDSNSHLLTRKRKRENKEKIKTETSLNKCKLKSKENKIRK